jgi:Xaa-Pro dipeptidase
MMTLKKVLFPIEEYRRRLTEVRKAMYSEKMDAIVVSTAENIYYLTGLGYHGYFIPHFLIVSLEGDSYLVARDQESRSAACQCHDEVVFVGRGDYENAGKVIARVIKECGLAGGRIGIDKNSASFPLANIEAMFAGLPQATFVDNSDMVEFIRACQSPLEVEFTIKAAKLTNIGIAAGIEAAGVGVSEREVVAAISSTMTANGGERPGFVPLVRSTANLGEGHANASDYRFKKGDPIILEASGCYERYHAPMARLLYIEKAPQESVDLKKIGEEAQQVSAAALKPGNTFGDAFFTWETFLKKSGYDNIRFEHCGYMTGIGFPQSWCGGPQVVGISRTNQNREVKVGMVFHLMTWLIRVGKGDGFYSNTVLITEKECEFLNKINIDLVI